MNVTDIIIKQNIETVWDHIAIAAGRTGRTAGDITLIAVSKTVDAAGITAAYHAGIRNFGENKAQDLCKKFDELTLDCNWHFIGQLQSNKVKDILGRACLIHSLCRKSQADEIECRAAQPVDALVQVNISGEDTKSGIEPGDALRFIELLAGYRQIRVKGLMTIGPLSAQPEQSRPFFAQLKRLSGLIADRFANTPNINMDCLSMGMSNDYAVAIEEGANMVRVGSAIFGPRRV